MLVGGAALSNRFTRLRIAPEYGNLVAYAPDAMSGLALANTIQEADERQTLARALEAETEELARAADTRQQASTIQVEAPDAGPQASARKIQDISVPNPPDLRLHVLRNFDLERIFPYINPQMLYSRHLGFKGRFQEALEAEESAALELRDAVRRVEEIILASPEITANAVFKFFPSQADGQRLLIYGPDGRTVLESFYFGRQSQRDGLCLADYVRAKSPGNDQGTEMDYVAMFVTSVGSGVLELSQQLREQGRFSGLSHSASPGPGKRRGLRRVAAPADPANVGLRRSGPVHLIKTYSGPSTAGSAIPLGIPPALGWKTRTSYSGCWTLPTTSELS